MAAMPPDDPFVEVKFRLRDNELRALQEHADSLGIPAEEAVRRALATELFFQALLAEGAVISYRKPDGSTGEVTF
jgi:hypothetical protein